MNSSGSSATRRRLAAIAVLDVVGYSRMMAHDEEGTLAALKAHRNELDPILLNHGGRIVKGTGDGLLVEVPSAVEAVRAAVEVQRLMAERNASVPEGRRMHLRIGVNLGDVIVEEDGDLFGDGVNVAARLEALSPVGGVCVSGSIHGQVANRVEVDFEAMGAVEVKNIPWPVEAWRIVLDHVADDQAPFSGSPYALPKVAVLPFQNMSHDPDQDYFADGVTEDLITALSHQWGMRSGMRVVSRSSVFALRGRSIDIRTAARELDATHVVEGSVRRAGDRVRVTAQLIEAETDEQLWAERFDRDLGDIFGVQDDLVAEISAHVRPHVERSEVRRREGTSPDELTMWDLVLRARQRIWTNSEDGVREAVNLLEQARDLEPDSAMVHTHLAYCWVTAAFNRWNLDGRVAFEEMVRTSAEAYRLDPTDPPALTAYGQTLAYLGRHDEAADIARRALAIAPDDGLVLLMAGTVGLFRGESLKAVEWLTAAWRLAGHESWKFHIATNLAFAQYLAGNYEAAWAWAQKGLDLGEYLQLRAIGAAALGQLRRSEEARRQLGYVISSLPDATTQWFLRNISWKDPVDVEHYREGLIAAGLTE